MGLGGSPNALSRPADGPAGRLYDGPGLSGAGGVGMDPTIGRVGAPRRAIWVGSKPGEKLWVVPHGLRWFLAGVESRV